MSPLIFVLVTLITPLWIYTEYWSEYREERRNGNLTKSRQQIFNRYRNFEFTLPNFGMIKTYPKDYFFLAYLEILTIAVVFQVLYCFRGIPNFSDAFLFSGMWFLYFEFYCFRRILLYREYKKNPKYTSQNEQEKPNYNYKNSEQESKNSSNNDDEFAYRKEKFNDPDEGRFDDDRFATPRAKAKYESMWKGYKDRKGNASERGKQFTLIAQADEGKIKDIKPWTPKE